MPPGVDFPHVVFTTVVVVCVCLGLEIPLIYAVLLSFAAVLVELSVIYVLTERKRGGDA